MIWEFRGPTAKRTADHHEIHLREYCQTESIPFLLISTEHPNESFSTANIVVEESYMQKLRTDLKPHRGQVYQEK